jgi:hypothetical protein
MKPCTPTVSFLLDDIAQSDQFLDRRISSTTATTTHPEVSDNDIKHYRASSRAQRFSNQAGQLMMEMGCGGNRAEESNKVRANLPACP